MESSSKPETSDSRQATSCTKGDPQEKLRHQRSPKTAPTQIHKLSNHELQHKLEQKRRSAEGPGALVFEREPDQSATENRAHARHDEELKRDGSPKLLQFESHPTKAQTDATNLDNAHYKDTLSYLQKGGVPGASETEGNSGKSRLTSISEFHGNLMGHSAPQSEQIGTLSNVVNTVAVCILVALAGVWSEHLHSPRTRRSGAKNRPSSMDGVKCNCLFAWNSDPNCDSVTHLYRSSDAHVVEQSSTCFPITPQWWECQVRAQVHDNN